MRERNRSQQKCELGVERVTTGWQERRERGKKRERRERERMILRQQRGVRGDGREMGDEGREGKGREEKGGEG